MVVVVGGGAHVGVDVAEGSAAVVVVAAVMMAMVAGAGAVRGGLFRGAGDAAAAGRGVGCVLASSAAVERLGEQVGYC